MTLLVHLGPQVADLTSHILLPQQSQIPVMGMLPISLRLALQTCPRDSQLEGLFSLSLGENGRQKLAPDVSRILELDSGPYLFCTRMFWL